MPSAVMNLEKYETLLDEERKGPRLHSGLRAMFDLEQNPGFRKRVTLDLPGETLMTLVSHGTLWKSDVQRPLTTLELALVQGFPSLPVSDKRMLWSPRSLLQDGRLSPRVFQSMMGNAWHVPTAGSLFMFFLSCVESRATSLPAAVRQMRARPADENSDEEAM